MSDSSEYRSVPGLLASVRDRWLGVAACALVGAVLGFSAMTFLPVQYSATTTLQIPPVSTDSGSASTIAPADAQNIATLDPQLGAIADKLGGGLTIEEVKSHLAVVNRPGTSLLNFTWTGRSAAEAERGADVAAEVYVDQAQDIVRTNNLKRPDATPPSPGLVVMAAKGSAERAGLPSWIYLPIGFLVGLLLGLVLAYLAELRRPRVHSRYHLSVLDARFRGRIARRDSVNRAAMLFVLPESLGERVGVTVLGMQSDDLFNFALRAMRVAEPDATPHVTYLEIATAAGMRDSRDLDGVFVLVREREVRVEELEQTLQGLADVGARVYGVILVAPGVAQRNSPLVPRPKKLGRTGHSAPVPGRRKTGAH